MLFLEMVLWCGEAAFYLGVGYQRLPPSKLMEQGQCEMIYGHCYYLRITEFGDNNGGGRIGELSKILFDV